MKLHHYHYHASVGPLNAHDPDHGDGIFSQETPMTHRAYEAMLDELTAMFMAKGSVFEGRVAIRSLTYLGFYEEEMPKGLSVNGVK